jgi:hypothetical protein
MIQVNLLPVERRRMERTPIGRFVLILLGVGLACASVAFFVYLEMLVRARQASREELRKDVESPKTAQINMDFAELTAKDQAHKSRKAVIDKLKAPFRWTDVIDILCEKLESVHKKVWFDEIRVLDPQEVRSRMQAVGSTEPIEAVMLVEANNAGADPEPFLNLRFDIVQKGKSGTAVAGPDGAPAGTPGGGAPPAVGRVPGRRSGKALIDYFNGGILKVVNFSLKEQAEYEEMYSQAFSLELFVRKAAAAPAK